MKKIAAVSAISICLTLLSIAGFPGLGDAATIYGCYGKLIGIVRIVSDPGKCDLKLEIPISWNSVGPQGPMGLNGPQGLPGPMGPTGPQGPIGNSGPTGPIGPAGATGATGAIGPTGPAGATGPVGAIGPAGTIGPQGPAGAAGATGPAGPVGPMGPTGPAGPIGLTGLTGSTGADGPAGPVGTAGAKGDTGSQGTKGDMGPAGPTGATGPAGPVGPAGVTGPIGPAGPQGLKGDTGAQGPQGSAGPAGIASFSALNGSDCTAFDGSTQKLIVVTAPNGVVTLTCPYPHKPVVFLSSATFIGNMGGLSGADSACQQLATNAGIQGIFKAWLSDSNSSPSTRFTQFSIPYVRVDGAIVAANWSGLISGTLINPINIDEHGVTVPNLPGAWTGTNYYGQQDASPFGQGYCGNWTLAPADTTQFAIFGGADATTQGWSHAGSNACYSPLHLYCFEQ